MSSERTPLAWDTLHPSTNAHAKFTHYPSRRSTVYGSRGMVACAQPLAASAGLAILNAGGNAADAAVAVAAALNVTEPCSTGIGGDAFCLFYDAKTKKVRAMNGSGRSPKGMTLDRLRKDGFHGAELPLTSIHTVTVPGAAAAWVDTVEKFGNGKVPLKDILAPAIKLAEDGYPVHEIVAYYWQRSEGLLKEASPSGHEMLSGGSAPRAGHLMKMPKLAATFRALGAEGKAGFYRGRIASAIVELVQSKGGYLELADLEAHLEAGTEEVDPISYTYNHHTDTEGVTLYECPPNGQGLTALIALGIIDELQNAGTIPDLGSLEFNGTQYLHVLIEAFHLAFADTRWFVADQATNPAPIDKLLSKEYLRKRAALISLDKALQGVDHGNPTSSSDTVYFSVTDEEGNACSFINSNYAGFGTGAVPAGCGFTLQNRGAGFVLDAAHPNGVAPSKRPYHTIIPGMALKGTELFLSYGVMGGYMQPQGHVQVLASLLHHGLTPQAALDAPRFCIGPGLPALDGQKDASSAGAAPAGDVFLEEGISPHVVKELHAMGHNVTLVEGWGRGQFGRGQVIMNLNVWNHEKDAHAHAAWAAASDPRADGMAVPQV